ncbi:DNA mismatch repair endonuclease MutH [Pleionea sp. CnH1-48]|uniref:DNA mismatch repair endonuclease MutH n=1 Tax=Pleionea sp. CnH1-48 TaxID=2954494 RepID=UPI002097C29A|nr:DNA mismatch repair endonuclease MutH [Pleionea sp. CnH1-48]MCO7225156.1 DNA mismatch repair endonuclease MutH [Pleionea sp. CnH1-48]
MPLVTPPQSIDELMKRAESLAGFSLGQLAQRYQSSMPDNLLLEKGWVGQFIEFLLGAYSGSLPEPDFPNLGIELKTLPVDQHGRPWESTYVSVLPLHDTLNEQWDTSVVKKKLSCVLWFPIVTDKGTPPEQRIAGMPLLWRPDQEQWNILRQDWEEAMEKVTLGKLGELNARFGQALQIRPKAANSRVLTDAIGPEGSVVKTLPRGFYLRRNFTEEILQKFYQL